MVNYWLLAQCYRGKPVNPPIGETIKRLGVAHTLATAISLQRSGAERAHPVSHNGRSPCFEFLLRKVPDLFGLRLGDEAMVDGVHDGGLAACDPPARLPVGQVGTRHDRSVGKRHGMRALDASDVHVGLVRRLSANGRIARRADANCVPHSL